MPIFSIAEILKEARRRRVFRAAGLYIVGAWAVLQVSDLAFPALGVPDASIRFVWIGLVVGFPIALIVGWRYELSDGRILRTRHVNSTSDLSLRRTDYVILSALAIAGASVIMNLIGQISETQILETYPPQPEEIEQASIAVPPFVNLSSDLENEYFADGIAEELLDGLANVPGLKVAARTSSFAFKGKGKDIRDIGRQLNVAYVLEGSVRVAGDDLRVTAQLIQASSGMHVWSKTYPSQLGNVFEIQDDIATKIVDALERKINVPADHEIQLGDTVSVEAYSAFLQGRTIARAVNPDSASINTAIEHLSRAIDIDPDYADAYVVLADAYMSLASHFDSSYDELEVERAKASAVASVATALSISPESSEALRAFGMISEDEKRSEAMGWTPPQP